MRKEIGREFGKAGRASDIKEKGRGGCMEASKTTVQSKGGLTKSQGSPAPKLVRKGVSEPMSPERGQAQSPHRALSQGRGSLQGCVFSVNEGDFRCSSFSFRRYVSMSSWHHSALHSSQHRSDSPPLGYEVIYHPPNLGGRIPLHQMEATKPSHWLSMRRC